MISALHLIWIIPLSVCFGYFIAALMVVAKKADKEINSHNSNKN